ncbi:MAG: sigma-54 dependent transcriptional regulator [Cytophagales bacterium]
MKNIEGFKIFAVEDDPSFSKVLEYTLKLDPEHEVRMFKNGKDLLNALPEKPSLITLDYSLPDFSGGELLQKINYYNKEIPVIIISGQEDVKTAVALIKEGAFDYISKEEDLRTRLLNSINKAKKTNELEHEIEHLREEIAHKYEFEKSIIGKSPSMQAIFKLLEKAVHTNITVSISGETGTGKEVVAKAIHYNSALRNKAFVAVNIAAVPKDLIESELFGHEKGAFTGAITQRKGKFEEANGGTIFLDEIGEMDINLQAKMLRVLQEREIIRVGGNKTIKLNVRILVATHRNLAEEIKKGNFREDLYYRLLGLPITLPPLRDRGSDILILAKHFLNSFAKENNMGSINIEESARKKLMAYSWPGNVRELKAVIELAAVMSDGDKLKAEDITFTSIDKNENFLLEEQSLRDYTFNIIRHFLKKYDDNVLLVAKKLNIGKSTLYRYLKEMEEDQN